MLFNTIPLIYHTSLLLLQGIPEGVDVGAITQKLLDIPGIVVLSDFLLHENKTEGARWFRTSTSSMFGNCATTRLSHPFIWRSSTLATTWRRPPRSKSSSTSTISTRPRYNPSFCLMQRATIHCRLQPVSLTSIGLKNIFNSNITWEKIDSTRSRQASKATIGWMLLSTRLRRRKSRLCLRTISR